MTAMVAKFSLAISSSPCSWRSTSRRIKSAIAGSALASGARRSIMVDLGDAPRVAAALESGLKPAVQDLHPFLLTHEAGRQDEHIRVVVLARQLGDLGTPDDRRAHARVPVGHVCHAETGPARQDGPLHDATTHGFSRGPRVIGVVVRRVDGLRPHVHRLAPHPLPLRDGPPLWPEPPPGPPAGGLL